LTELAKENDPPEVIGVVCSQAFQLLTNGHDTNGIARSRRATNFFLVPILIPRYSSDLLQTV
jgi:hypothetical protein